MSYRILTKNGIENTNIDGARDNNFNAGRRSGIVKGVLNECEVFLASSNTIAVKTGELRLCGHRIVIEETESMAVLDTPTSSQRYSLVAEVGVSNNNVTFGIFVKSANFAMVQNDLDKTTTGIYQLELAKFTQTTDGSLTDIVRTADIITGGSTGNNEHIVIGDVLTNMIDAGLNAEVDIENQFNNDGTYKQTDFNFSIPEPSISEDSNLVASVEISLPTNSINISGLDLVADGGVYDIVINSSIDSMYTAGLSMKLNNTTGNSYYFVVGPTRNSSGTVIRFDLGQVGANPTIKTMTLSASGQGSINPACSYVCLATGGQGLGSQTILGIYGGILSTQNITSIELYIAEDELFGIGTSVKIYKRS